MQHSLLAIGMAREKWGYRIEAHVSTEDEVVDDAHDATHGVGKLIVVAVGAIKIDGPSIAQEASGEQLVVYIQRGCA